jgi:hypothetical protein
MASKANLGLGSNNKGELKALYVLLKCVVDRNIAVLQVFGDLELTIN